MFASPPPRRSSLRGPFYGLQVDSIAFPGQCCSDCHKSSAIGTKVKRANVSDVAASAVSGRDVFLISGRFHFVFRSRRTCLVERCAAQDDGLEFCGARVTGADVDRFASLGANVLLNIGKLPLVERAASV